MLDDFESRWVKKENRSSFRILKPQEGDDDSIDFAQIMRDKEEEQKQIDKDYQERLAAYQLTYIVICARTNKDKDSIERATQLFSEANLTGKLSSEPWLLE